MAMSEQLESEINQKINALNDIVNAQFVLLDTLKSNTKTVVDIEKKLNDIEAYLKYSNETIYKLKQENLRLKTSCDEWIRETINLESKLLNVGDVARNRK